jgi:hypothetical protein
MRSVARLRLEITYLCCSRRRQRLHWNSSPGRPRSPHMQQTAAEALSSWSAPAGDSMEM